MDQAKMTWWQKARSFVALVVAKALGVDKDT
jgi:hypothetical protein